MKLSYKKIIITISLLLLFLILNLLLYRIDNYLFLIFPVLFTLIMLIYEVGYERKYYYREKDIILNLLIYIICYLITTYLLGVFTGFTSTTYNLSIISVISNVFPVFLFILVSEYFRYEVLRKGSKNKIILFLVVVIFVVLDMSLCINYYNLSGDGLLKMIALVIIPSISKNLFLTYLVSTTGFGSSILYRSILELKMFVLPIYPDFGIYIDSLLNVLFPAFCFMLIYQYFNRKYSNKIRRKEGVHIISIIGYNILIFFILSVVILNSGLFKYSLFSIGSQSMEPNINKGDVIILEKLKDSTDVNIKKGDVIAFRSSSIVVSHRVVKILNVNGVNYYYTKGDNNKEIDKYPVVLDDIVGVFRLRIRALGWPSVILGELLSKR